MKRPLVAALAAGLTLAALVAPASASAAGQNGIDVKTYKISYLQYPKTGKARAQLRNITVTWRRDRVEKRIWVTVNAQLRDSGPGDGYCARMTLWREINSWNGEEAQAKECNGVWQTRSLAVSPTNSGHASLTLYTNPQASGERGGMHLSNPWYRSPGGP